MKKTTSTALILILSVMLVIAGCGNSNSNSAGNSNGNENKSKVNETAKNDKAEAVSGASEASYTPLDQLKDNYDIVIVGAGGAGMSAALEAKAKGLNPVILEKCRLQVGIQVNPPQG